MAIDPQLDEILGRDPGAEAPAPEAEAPVAEAETAPAAEADVLDDLAGVPEDTKFDAAYVKKLRQEAAQYRTRAKQYDVFEKYDEQDRQVWTKMAELYQQDPVAAAEYMAAIADGVRKAQAPEAPVAGDEQPLTASQVQAMLAERDQKAAVAAEQVRIEAEAKSLGYEVGSRQYKYLIQTAIDDTAGDLKAAHEAIEAERQAIIDQYVGGKARDAAGSPIAPAAGAGTMPSTESAPPKTFRDAKAAIYEMLENSR